MNYINLIQRTIDYIEERLDAPIVLNEAAQQSYLSPFHFHRIFRMWVGEPIAKYIRKRRISRSASNLLESNKRIIDIAVECGFSSHEAFTRSFKQVTGIAPEQYRTLNVPSFNYPKLNLAESELFSIHSCPFAPEVSITLIESFEVVADILENLLITEASNNMKDNQIEIEEFWKSIQPVAKYFHEQVGVIIPTGGLRYNYLAGVRINKNRSYEIPDNWETRNINKQLYAVISHHGNVIEIPELYKYVLGMWLPKFEYELVFAPELEIYRFDTSGKMIIDIYIPIKKNY